jgi:hypothetical protein
MKPIVTIWIIFQILLLASCIIWADTDAGPLLGVLWLMASLINIVWGVRLLRTHRGWAAACLFLAVVQVTLIVLPWILPPKVVSSRSACVANLEAIQRLKLEWSKSKGKSPDDTPTIQDLFGTNNGPNWMPSCPSGGEYRIGSVKEKPTCSLGPPVHVMPEK